MKNRMIRSVLIILAAAALVAPLPAQNQNQMNSPRQRVQANLAALRLVRLTQALDLTEDQTAKVFPALNRIEKSKQDMQINLSREVQALRRMSQDPETKDAAFEETIAEIKDLRARIKDLDNEGDAALAAVLTLRQKARYEIFQIDFLRGLNETMNQVRQRLGRNGGGAVAPPIKKQKNTP
jgi:Spy/CpxP family protein refolding chaperone